MPLNQPTREEAIELVKKTALVQRQLEMDYVTPIFWPVHEPDQPTEVANGTTFFLDNGQGVFGVTAGHVFDGYMEQKRRYGRPCFVGTDGLHFDLEERLIAVGRQDGDGRWKVDVATYRVLESEVARLCTRSTPTSFSRTESSSDSGPSGASRS